MVVRYELSFGKLGEWFVFFGGLCDGGKVTCWLEFGESPIVVWAYWASVYKWLLPEC